MRVNWPGFAVIRGPSGFRGGICFSAPHSPQHNEPGKQKGESPGGPKGGSQPPLKLGLGSRAPFPSRKTGAGHLAFKKFPPTPGEEGGFSYLGGPLSPFSPLPETSWGLRPFGGGGGGGGVSPLPPPRGGG
eukprot:FR741133.1.p2 GENE.FR741133.1~~FR741133.1.p2  ORF type:complete len:131 (+),score=50.52 FR741133.1:800-1192(+)